MNIDELPLVTSKGVLLLKKSLLKVKHKEYGRYIWMSMVYILNGLFFMWNTRNYFSWESSFLYLLGVAIGFSFFHNMIHVNIYTGFTLIINLLGIIWVTSIGVGKAIHIIYIICALGVFYMITRQRIQTECSMIETKLFEKTRFDNIKDGVIVFEYNNLRAIECNNTIYSFIKEKELIGKYIYEIFEDLILLNKEQLEDYFQNENEEVILQNKKLGSKWVDLNMKLFYVFDTKYLLLCISDVSFHREYKENIEYIAYHDSLTNLPNRRYGNKKLKYILEEAKKEKTMMGVMFIDLDKFKFANDLLGHVAGDELLKEVGKRIQKSIRKDDIVVRVGGDEFMVLIDNFHCKDEVIYIADRIVGIFSKPFCIKNREVFVTCSIGISIFPYHGKNIEHLLERADIAMYEAKKDGRNNYKIYDKEMEENILVQKTVHL